MADISNEELRKEITGKWQYPSIYQILAFVYHKIKVAIIRAVNYSYVCEWEYVRNQTLYSCDATTLARTYVTKWRAPRRPLQPWCIVFSSTYSLSEISSNLILTQSVRRFFTKFFDALTKFSFLVGFLEMDAFPVLVL